MTYTLAAATLALARILTDVRESTATGGSATTLLDTDPSVVEADDYYNQGTIWPLSGNNAGKTAVITDYTNSSGTFTFATMTTLNAAGNLYAVANKEFPRRLLRQAINAALKTIGGIPAQYTDAAFVTVADQEAYTLPAGVYNVKRVEIAYNSTAPYCYYIHQHWVERGGKIYFDSGTEPDADGYLIRLTYQATPADLTADTDTIDDHYHPDRLKWTAAVHAWRWQVERRKDDDQNALRMLNEAISNAGFEAQRHQIPQLSKDSRLAGW